MTTLPEIRAIAEAATPGPWWVRGENDPISLQGVINGERVIAQTNYHFDTGMSDARFIAASRTLLPLLVEVAEAAQHARETLLERLLHGDDQHRQWLRDEVAFVFAPQDRALAKLEAAKI